MTARGERVGSCARVLLGLAVPMAADAVAAAAKYLPVPDLQLLLRPAHNGNLLVRKP